VSLARIPQSALPQLYSDGLHATVAAIVVICNTILAFVGKVPADVTGAVYTGVVGYVAGRAGSSGGARFVSPGERSTDATRN